MAYWYKVLLIAAIVGLLFSPQVSTMQNLLLNTNQQLVQNQQSGSSARAYWMDLANSAWQYYQPGVGVSSSTGLHYAHLNYQGFTDWDLGVYVQAVVDAAKLGIISNGGDWGFDNRMDKVLTFLENRPVSSDGTPYTWYSSLTGENTDQTPQYAIDAANLLVALKNAELYRPTLANRIDTLVKTRVNYEPLRQAVEALSGSINIYDYYATAAFATFWPERFNSQANSILNNINNAPTITYEGVTLPKAKLMCEPLLISVFCLPQNSNLMNLARKVYLAHEARYNVTGEFAAFSEGNPAGVAEHYVWEWVVLPDGRTWVTLRDETTDAYMTPVVFLKAAVGLFALYNTKFSENMINDMVPDLRTSTGFLEGKTETGQTVSFSSDKTNGMLLAAARYAIDNNSSAPNPPEPVTVTPSAGNSPEPSFTEPNASVNPNATANPNTTESPAGNATPSSTNTSTLPSNSISPGPSSSVNASPSASSSPPPTVDAFSLTQPLIIAASVVAIFTLLLLAIIYRKRKTKQNIVHQTN